MINVKMARVPIWIVPLTWIEQRAMFEDPAEKVKHHSGRKQNHQEPHVSAVLSV